MSLTGVTLDDEMLSVVLNTLGEKNVALKKELAAAKEELDAAEDLKSQREEAVANLRSELERQKKILAERQHTNGRTAFAKIEEDD